MKLAGLSICAIHHSISLELQENGDQTNLANQLLYLASIPCLYTVISTENNNCRLHKTWPVSNSTCIYHAYLLVDQINIVVYSLLDHVAHRIQNSIFLSYTKNRTVHIPMRWPVYERIHFLSYKNILSLFIC